MLVITFIDQFRIRLFSYKFLFVTVNYYVLTSKWNLKKLLCGNILNNLTVF